MFGEIASIVAALALQAGTGPWTKYQTPKTPWETSRVYSQSQLPGSALATECAKREGLEFDPCVAFIIGAAEAFSMTGRYCLRNQEGWTAQTVAVVRKYLKDHPEEWNASGARLVARALGSFPCKP